MALKNNKETRRNGFIYSPGTAAGFLRMQRQGIPRPVFAIEEKLRKLLTKKFRDILRGFISDFKLSAQKAGIAPEKLTKDSEDDSFNELLEFFTEMGEELKKAEEVQNQVNYRMQVGSALNNLNEKWNQEEKPSDPKMESELSNILEENQNDYSERLEADASEKLKEILNSFSIDKKQVYENNLELIRKLYLDNSMERVYGVEDYLKHLFIEKINDYVTGKSDNLDIKGLSEQLYNSSAHMAKFFARDQLARLNKATTLSTFQSAGVTKVKWVTTHDIRVRESHRKLDGKIFDVHSLPSEVDDYNCRCGLVPVEWEN